MKWSHILACVVGLTVSATASKRPILWSSVTMEKRGLATLNLQVLGTPGSQVLYLAGLPNHGGSKSTFGDLHLDWASIVILGVGKTNIEGFGSWSLTTSLGSPALFGVQALVIDPRGLALLTDADYFTVAPPSTSLGLDDKGHATICVHGKPGDKFEAFHIDAKGVRTLMISKKIPASGKSVYGRSSAPIPSFKKGESLILEKNGKQILGMTSL